MFLPIGDDVEKRSLPLMATVIIAANIMVWVHTGTLGRAAAEGAIAEHVQEGQVIGMDLKGQPIIATRELLLKKAVAAKKWGQFMQEWGLVPSAVAEGDVHGLFSHMFLHPSVWQLVANILVFWVFAGTLEATLGPWLILLFYLFWGVVAGLLQTLAAWNSHYSFVSATGAIAGLMGAYFLCFGLLARIKVLLYFGLGIPARIVEIPASVFVGLWAVVQVWYWLNADKVGVFNVGLIAQLCGFTVGVLTMVVFRSEVTSKLNRNKEGKWEVVHEQDQRRSSAKLPVVPAAETKELQTVTTEVPTAKPKMPAPKCANCGGELADENRVVDDLFRCPNCKMLSDASQPALAPRSKSRSR